MAFATPVFMKTQNLFTSTRIPKPDPEQIAIAAYHLYMERGGADGHDLEDWLHAEELLMTAGSTAPLKRKPDERTRGFSQARDERGSASREEIRRQSTPSRPAARHSAS
jgi:hypothetical protein